MKLVLLATIALVACSNGGDCKRAVHRVFEIVANPTGHDPPGADERDVIEQIETQTLVACEREGLTVEQRDCILAMRTMADFQTVTSCPAIAAKKPSWLIAGPLPGK